jgi:type VI secretion system secreted protein VgrG
VSDAELEDFAVEQARRVLSVESFAPGVNKILVTSFEGVEELSGLSHFRLEIVSKGRGLKPSEVLGQKLCIAIRRDQHVRKFYGVISRLDFLQTSIRGMYLHAIELSPPAWTLTLNQKFRIFEQRKATDVVTQILNDAGVTARVKTTGETREYTVQYAESDFNIIARLLEDEGLFFRFAHDQADCTMIVGDGSADYLPGTEVFELHRDLDIWQPQYRPGASVFKHAAWDFKSVSLWQGSERSVDKMQAPGLPPQRLFQEYPGRQESADEAQRFARMRMQAQEAGFVWIRASSSNPWFEVAKRFKIKDHKIDLPGAEKTTDSYVVVRVVHRAQDSSELPFEGMSTYTNDLVCIPADVEFRPQRITPRPYIRGPQTATVVDGPDEFGRVKVKFHWEPENSSRWTRVAQSWAFNRMGTQFIPRIDSEVVVEHLDGDPDHPLIVGSVYNGSNDLLYDLPSHKTQSGVRSANWGGPGTPDKSNELRFEDEDGSEEIYLHAQRDFRRVVVHDEILKVETGDLKETVETGNHSLNVDLGSSSVDALKSITLTVGQNSITIDQKGVTIKGLMVKIEGQVTVDVTAPMTTVKGDAMLVLKGGLTTIN